MNSEIIEKLRKLFADFPGIGAKTALRFVYYLIYQPEQKVTELLETIRKLKSKIKICPQCFSSFEGEEKLCPICSDQKRKKDTVLLVEKEIDLEAIEKTGSYDGLYFVLGGNLTKLAQENTKKLEERLNFLIKRIKDKEIKEVILGLNPTTEGKYTQLWLERKLKPFQVKITALAKGLPVGGELEYADPETIFSAIKNRK